MKKSILNINGVLTLSKTKLKSINGKGATFVMIGLCDIQYDVCNVAYPDNHDEFVGCMVQKGC